MFLGKVVGTVVSTQKDPKLAGGKLLIVQHLTLDLEPAKTFVVAMDSVGAGKGELVICAAGSSARMTKMTEGLPVDTVILAIVDSLEIGGEVVFRKEVDET